MSKRGALGNEESKRTSTSSESGEVCSLNIANFGGIVPGEYSAC